MAALLAGAVARHQHAGGIQAVLADTAALRGAHARIGPALQRAHQGIEPARVRHGIVVERGDIRRGGGFEALVDGRAETGVARVLDDPGARRGAVAADQARAAVIDHDDFEIAPGLPRERFHALPQPRIRGQSGDHDRYEQLPASPILAVGAGLGSNIDITLTKVGRAAGRARPIMGSDPPEGTP